MKLKIELFGSKCNEYPVLTILHNGCQIYSSAIVENYTIEVDIQLQDTNLITLAGIGKSNGENGVWDTRVDPHGNITEDKYLKINNIWMDDILLDTKWVNSLEFVSDRNKSISQFIGWYENGTVDFIINLPLLDWIILEKFIKFELQTSKELSSNARSGEAKFDYY